VGENWRRERGIGVGGNGGGGGRESQTSSQKSDLTTDDAKSAVTRQGNERGGNGG